MQFEKTILESLLTSARSRLTTLVPLTSLTEGAFWNVRNCARVRGW